MENEPIQPDFSLDCQDEGQGRLLYILSGELDIYSGPVLEQHYRDILYLANQSDTNGIATIIFDLSAIGYIDSSGIKSIVVAKQLATELNNLFVLRNPSESIKRILQIMGLEDSFVIDRVTD